MRAACGHRRTPGGDDVAASITAPVMLLLAALAVSLPTAGAQQAWTVVTDPRQLEQLEIVGPRQASFDRAPPLTQDPALLPDYAAQLNLLQELAVDGSPTPFTATSEQARSGDGQAGWADG